MASHRVRSTQLAAQEPVPETGSCAAEEREALPLIRALELSPRGNVLHVPFRRLCALFGKEGGIEIDSALAIHPDQALRVLGIPLTTLLRAAGQELPLREFKYALEGKHRPTSTTRRSIESAFGPRGDDALALLDGYPSPWLQALGQWGALEAGFEAWREPPPGWLFEPVRFLAQVSRLADEHRIGADRADRINARLTESLGRNPVEEWRDVLAPEALAAAPALSTALTALAIGDIADSPAGAEVERSVVLALTAADTTPLSQWLCWVRQFYRVSNNKQLEMALATRGAYIEEPKQQREGPKKQRIIGQNLLNKWASGAQLMRWQSVAALLSGLPDREREDPLYRCYGVARLLTFLIEALVAYRKEPPGSRRQAKAQAQAALRARYAHAHRALLAQR